MDRIDPVVLGRRVAAGTGRIARSRSQRCAFIADNPCPVTGSRDCRKSCPGYHVSHIVALACCGDDDPSNMEWQTARENLREGARCPWDPPRASPARSVGAAHRLRPCLPHLLRQEGRTVIVLLAGGDKATQAADIKAALRLARDL